METETLYFRLITEADQEIYYQLNIDDDLNKYWGYDYKTEIKPENVTSQYFYIDAIQDIKFGCALVYIVRLKSTDEVIGEAVIHDIKGKDTAEIGFRIFKQFHNLGYGKQICNWLIKQTLVTMQISTVAAKCFKQNIASYKILSSLMNVNGDDGEFCYFEQAILKTKEQYCQLLGKEVEVIIDRPINSYHPIYNDLKYELNYGYIQGFFTLDNEEVDAYILNCDEPIVKYRGQVIGVVVRKDDVECKLIVAKENNYRKDEIIKKIDFMEKWFVSEIILI